MTDEELGREMLELGRQALPFVGVILAGGLVIVVSMLSTLWSRRRR